MPMLHTDDDRHGLWRGLDRGLAAAARVRGVQINLRVVLAMLFWLACVIPPAAWAIVGGKLARPADWRAVARLHTGDEQHCSAVLVGPRVVLTAAHCVADPSHPSEVEFRGVRIRARMIVSPDYADPFLDGLDLAVGVLERAPVGVTPLPVTDGEEVLRVGDAVTLLGFGCCARGREGGELRLAESEVLSVGDHFFDIGDPSAPVWDGPGLCYGDSGGPALVLADDGLRVVGVHSQGMSDACIAKEARLDSVNARAFLRSVAAEQQVAICGVTAQCAPSPDPRIRRR